MSSIAEWVVSLGMAEYSERFAEDDIDFDILGRLTDRTLKSHGTGAAWLGACFAHETRQPAAFYERALTRSANACDGAGGKAFGADHDRRS